MRPRTAILITAVCALLTFGLTALLMNISDRKREGTLLDNCPCPSESCPHRGLSVK